MKNTSRLSFKFYRSYYDVFNELNRDDKLLFIEAVLNKQFLGVDPELTGMAKFAYISQANSIQQQIKGFESVTGIHLTPEESGPPLGPPLQVQEQVKGKVEVKKKGATPEENSLPRRTKFPKQIIKLTPTQIRTKQYIPLASKLADIISSKQNIKKVSEAIIKNWADQMRLLHEVNGIHIDRMKKILRWYKTAIGQLYIPQVESGWSFREKFTKLESAKKRTEEDSKHKNKSNTKPRNAHKDGFKRKWD